MYQWKATAHSLYERQEGDNDARRRHNLARITLQADQFGATKKLLTEVFGLTPAIEEDGWTLFPMSNGTMLDLYAPQAIPAYGYNHCGIVFGFRVEDIEAASEELAEAGCELLGEITRIEDMNYRYRHFKGPDGRVYGINEQKK
jgi:predicted enzyme related to lactoylglutathione lyase